MSRSDDVARLLKGKMPTAPTDDPVVTGFLRDPLRVLLGFDLSCLDRALERELDGFVYFVHGAAPECLVKIGYSNDPKKRIEGFQTGSPVELHQVLVIRGDRLLEQELHAAFASRRVHGEWFEGRVTFEALRWLPAVQKLEVVL